MSNPFKKKAVDFIDEMTASLEAVKSDASESNFSQPDIIADEIEKVNRLSIEISVKIKLFSDALESYKEISKAYRIK